MNLQINVKARGPMGLEELTSYKWLGIGTGQIRTYVKENQTFFRLFQTAAGLCKNHPGHRRLT